MAEASMLIRDVIAMIQDRWDMEDIDAEAAAQLFRGLAVRLLDKVQGHPDAAGITTQTVVEPRDYPFHPGDPVWTSAGLNLRQWYVDQAGGWVEAEPLPTTLHDQESDRG